MIASLGLGDRQRNDLFVGNLTTSETIRLGRNLLLWGAILALLGFVLRLTIFAAPPIAAPNPAGRAATSPTAAPVAINPATAPRANSGSYQAICVPPKNGGLNLRATPSSAAAVIAVIPCNATGLQPTGATVAAAGGQWVPITYSGTPGWVYRGLIRQTP